MDKTLVFMNTRVLSFFNVGGMPKAESRILSVVQERFNRGDRAMEGRATVTRETNLHIAPGGSNSRSSAVLGFWWLVSVHRTRVARVLHKKKAFAHIKRIQTV